MKILIVLALAALISAHGFIQEVAIPLGEEIQRAEASADQSKVAGSTQLGQFPWQAGLLARYKGINGTGVCGGSLVSANRVFTAASCWFDGIIQAYVFTVVLGSPTLFTGGTRQETSDVVVHPNWNPIQVNDDVALIKLPTPASLTETIKLVPLPTRSEFNSTFSEEIAFAPGFCRTSDAEGISAGLLLSRVELNITSNSVCFVAFPLIFQDSNICAFVIGGNSTCRFLSGGSLIVTRENRNILVGITSYFVGPLQYQVGSRPVAFARATSFIDFFNQHL